jgi:Zn-dependent protease with chaperone function
MKTLRARYFDGTRSEGQDVTVVLTGSQLKIIGRDVDKSFEARGVRRSLRIADTPRWLYLPGGGTCVTQENDVVDRMTRDRRYERLLHRWESRPAYAALAVALVVLTAWLLVDRGLPLAVEAIAERIPVEAESVLGKETLKGLDGWVMKPSALPPARQAALRAKLERMKGAAGDATPYRLEFRASRILGPNAFALPSGIIVMTDELAALARSDEELLAVLAHEVGHVRHRHTMRRLLEGSATALVIAALTGDLASATSLAASAPALLVQTRYSRDNERQADAFAVDMMRKASIDPRHLGIILARLERQHGGPGLPTFLSTHPNTSDRQAMTGDSDADLRDAGEVAEPQAGHEAGAGGRCIPEEKNPGRYI